MLVTLTENELDALAPIESDGSISVDAQIIAMRISQALGVLDVRVAVAGIDYMKRPDGTPEPHTRCASGVWWHSRGNDTAIVGGFVIDGLAMTLVDEGIADAPVAEAVDVIERATRVIASEYGGARIIGPGLLSLRLPQGEKRVRVVVTRDYRIRRPQDLLDQDELTAFGVGDLGFAIVQLIGDGKALVVKQGI